MEQTRLLRSPVAPARVFAVDDCWGERDNTTHQIIGDPARFPEGMPAFIKKLHAMVRFFRLFVPASPLR